MTKGYPRLIQDGQFQYVDLGKKVPTEILFEKMLNLGQVPDRELLGMINNMLDSGLNVPAFSHSRCPYCGSASPNDERGNCAACGGPR